MSYAVKPVPGDKALANDGNNALGLVSLILGIVGLVTGGCPFSIGATITGWMAMKREPAGTARIGFWLGVVGMVLQTLLGLFVLVLFGAGLGLGLTSVRTSPPQPAPPQVVESEFMPPVEAAPAIEAPPIQPAVDEAPSTAP